MDHLPQELYFAPWLQTYGTLGLFFLLAAGIFALPVPEESLLVLAGAFVEKGTLGLPETFAASIGGSIFGITLSYFLGKWAGAALKDKLKWIGITEERIHSAQKWTLQYGKWMLVIGYFIPGLHHLTGFAAGMGRLRYYTFAFFAYSGAFIWVITFLSFGYLLGKYGHAFFATFKTGTTSGAVILLSLVILFGIISRFKKSSKNTPANTGE